MDVCAVFEFKVRSYECGPDGRATFPTVCNYLQEAAGEHAEQLGFSKSNFAAEGENISWVLTRLRVRMSRLPVWQETVLVETYPRGGRRITAHRDFVLRVGDETIGVATSEWMIIDLATRKIHAIPETVFAANDPANVPVLGLEPFSKFRFPESGGGTPPPQVSQFCWGGTQHSSDRFAAASPVHSPPQVPHFCGAGASRPRKEMTFTAMKSQIDLNGHVNNVHYISWMLEPCESRCPAEMEVVFRSETFAGDEVRVETAASDGFTYHRVSAPDGKDHIVARTKG